MKQRIYLDNAATTHPKPETVYKTADKVLRAGGNAGRGGHSFSRAAAEVVFVARSQAAAFFGIGDSERLVFTANATQALNTALFGLIKPGMTVVTTAVEHNAVVRPLKALERDRGIKVLVTACDEGGRIDLPELERNCKQADIIVATHASNVSGLVFPLKQLAAIAVRYSLPFIVDAAQTAGSELIEFDKLQLAAMVCSGHKNLFGVQGCGLLAVGKNCKIAPLIFGGTGSQSESAEMPDFLPDALESGTQNAAAIATLAAGLEFIDKIGRETIWRHKIKLADYLRSELAAIIGLNIHGATADDERTNVVSCTVNNCDSGEIAWRLDDEYGIAVRPGMHCSPWAHRALGTLQTGTLRFSPGWFNTELEMEQVVEAVRKLSNYQVFK
ncbi:MAG: aminotransferase class V-fold PLP-dependent enzyme [Negativicutes bacterium]|jgi:cysteine desulfurase family protein